MQIIPQQVKNILVVRNDRFGEFLLNIPALRALKETFINARIISVVNPGVKELAESVPFIDEVIAWGREKHSLYEKAGLISLLRAKNIDMAVMLNPSKEFNVFTFLAGIPVRAGYNRKWGFLLTHKIEDRKYLGQKHEIEYNLELAGAVGAKTGDLSLSLEIDEAAAESFGLKGINLLALHPWTSDPIKQWPAENFRGLTDRLIRELGIKIIVVGGKEEFTKSLEFCRDFNKDSLLNLTGKTTLKQLAAVLKRCRLLISGDSGPVHLASCAGIPAVAIFRSDMAGKSALRWGPRSQGSVVLQKDSLEQITVDEVFKMAKEVLAKK